MALTRAMKQILWMHAAMDEVSYPQPKPAILYNNNSGAILLTQNTKNNTKVKHIDICYHYICERVEEGEIEVRRVASANNLANMFTKQLPRVAFQKHCAALRLYESSQGRPQGQHHIFFHNHGLSCPMSQSIITHSLYIRANTFLHTSVD